MHGRTLFTLRFGATQPILWQSNQSKNSMSEQSQPVSRRGGARPGAGRPVGSLGPKHAARGERVRRRRELVEIYTRALGGSAGLSESRLVDVRKAAELVALAEAARELVLQQGPGSPGALSAMIRLESASVRAIRALRLPAAPNAAAPMGLHDIVSRHAAGRANVEKAD
jgi:hypothetical protein